MLKRHRIHVSLIALMGCGFTHAAFADDASYNAPITDSARDRQLEGISKDLLNLSSQEPPVSAPVAAPIVKRTVMDAPLPPVVQNTPAPVVLKKPVVAGAASDISISDDIKNETAPVVAPHEEVLKPVVLIPPPGVANLDAPHEEVLAPVVLKDPSLMQADAAPASDFIPPPAPPSPPPAPVPVREVVTTTTTTVREPIAAAEPSQPLTDEDKFWGLFLGKPHVDAGVDASVYKYREKVPGTDPFVNNSGYPGGIEFGATEQMVNHWYLRGEGRAVYSHVDYSSASGHMSHQPNYFGEARGLVGKDFILDNNTLSPYTGAGYRYLYNDARGETDSGSMGYRRISQYKYVPVGVTETYTMPANDLYKLSGNIEYDFFTGGLQKSYLGDTGSAAGDIMNRQHHGKGIRGDTLFHVGSWSFGPWFDYWHIRASDFVPIPGVPGYGGEEPDNKTTEVGLKLVKQFW